MIQANLPSINQDPSTFAASVDSECQKGRYAGLFTLANPSIISMRVNPCGLVPKRDTNPVVYRVINHQSAPDGISINDSINKEDFAMNYEHVGNTTCWI